MPGADSVLEARAGCWRRLVYGALAGGSKADICQAQGPSVLGPIALARRRSQGAPAAMRPSRARLRSRACVLTAALQAGTAGRFAALRDFRAGALRATNLGGSSRRRSAAVYGALAGAHYGVAAIPSAWRRDTLARHDLIERSSPSACWR